MAEYIRRAKTCAVGEKAIERPWAGGLSFHTKPVPVKKHPDDWDPSPVQIGALTL